MNPHHLAIMGRARETPGSWQSRFREKGDKVSLLLGTCLLVRNALRHGCCHTFTSRASVAMCRAGRGVTAAPQSPACAAEALQPWAPGEKKMLGRCWHAATYHTSSQHVRSGKGGDPGEAGTWLKAHWKDGVNHSPNSIAASP